MRARRLYVVVVACLAFAGAAACGAHAPARPVPAPAPTVDRELARAEAAERARRHDEARVHYQRAIAAAVAAADPATLARARRAYGETLAHWGELPAAIAELQGAVAAHPVDASAWHDLGILRHAHGDRAGAVAALTRAVALAPSDPRPGIALAALHWRSGDRRAAAAQYRKLLALDLPSAVRRKVEWALDELAKPPP